MQYILYSRQVRIYFEQFISVSALMHILFMYSGLKKKERKSKKAKKSSHLKTSGVKLLQHSVCCRNRERL